MKFRFISALIMRRQNNSAYLSWEEKCITYKSGSNFRRLFLILASSSQHVDWAEWLSLPSSSKLMCKYIFSGCLGTRFSLKRKSYCNWFSVTYLLEIRLHVIIPGQSNSLPNYYIYLIPILIPSLSNVLLYSLRYRSTCYCFCILLVKLTWRHVARCSKKNEIHVTLCQQNEMWDGIWMQ